MAPKERHGKIKKICVFSIRKIGAPLFLNKNNHLAISQKVELLDFARFCYVQKLHKNAVQRSLGRT